MQRQCSQVWVNSSQVHVLSSASYVKCKSCASASHVQVQSNASGEALGSTTAVHVVIRSYDRYEDIPYSDSSYLSDCVDVICICRISMIFYYAIQTCQAVNQSSYYYVLLTSVRLTFAWRICLCYWHFPIQLTCDIDSLGGPPTYRFAAGGTPSSFIIVLWCCTSLFVCWLINRIK